MEAINPQQAAEMAHRRLADEAALRAKDVKRGLESARLAGFIIQREGYGMVKALDVVYGKGGCRFGYQDVDRIVGSVDPDWRSHQQQRWSAIADLDFSRPRAPDEGTRQAPAAG